MIDIIRRLLWWFSTWREERDKRKYEELRLEDELQWQLFEIKMKAYNAQIKRVQEESNLALASIPRKEMHNGLGIKIKA